MIYSELFAEGVGGAGSTAIYTVPSDGATYVLRDIILIPVSAGVTQVDITTTTALYYSLVAPGQFTNNHEELRQVLVPGQTLDLSVAAGSVSYRLSGYRLV